MWEIKGLPGEIIALDVTEFDLKNCSRSQLIVRDAVNDTLIGTYCGDSKPGRIESHGSQMSVEFTSDGFGDGERFMVQFHRGELLFYSSRQCILGIRTLIDNLIVSNMKLCLRLKIGHCYWTLIKFNRAMLYLAQRLLAKQT